MRFINPFLLQVLANYILVITFMLSALTIWARFVEPIERKVTLATNLTFFFFVFF